MENQPSETSPESFPKTNFVGLHRGEEVNALQKIYPSAFLLLCLIARRARYRKDPCKISGLRYGQAFIGDYKEAGLKSESSYRKAKERLQLGGLCTFVGYKSGANRGTVATLLPQGIFSIDSTGRANDGADERRTNDDQKTDEERLTTKKQGNKENKETKKPSPPSNPPKGESLSASDLIKEIPDDWSPVQKQAAKDWAEDKQSRSPKRERYRSLNQWRTNLKRMSLYHPSVLQDAIEQAIASGWQGWEQESVKAKLQATKAPAHVKIFTPDDL